MYVHLSYGRGFKGLIEYQLESKEETKNRVVGGNVIGSTKQITAQFVDCAGQRKGVRKPVAHLIVAWHPDDEVDDHMMGVVGERLLESLGVDGDDHQYLMVRHLDTDHPHMHLVLNRVGVEGQLLTDKNFPAKRLRERAHELDRKFNFTPVSPKGVDPERARDLQAEPIRVGKALDLGGDDSPPKRLQQVEKTPLGARQEIRLKKMEERSGLRSAKHKVYSSVLTALEECDGSWESLDIECRAAGVAPAWSFTEAGEFNGASFTLMSSTRPGEAETGAHGGTYTFKGSQLGPKGGLNRGFIQKTMDTKLRAAERVQRPPKVRVGDAAKQLRGSHSGKRFVLGPNLGRRVRWAQSYKNPLPGRSVQALLRLFDNRQVARMPQTPIRPSQKPRR